MRIFVSYARVDKPYCIRIVETLHAHEVWYDQRLYAGQHWWKEILRRLEWCEIFIYFLSPDSVNSIYCRKELEVARKLGREIIPVLINNKTKLPEELRDLHYVDMSGGVTVDNVSVLHSSILVVERDIIPSESPNDEEMADLSETMVEDAPIAGTTDSAEMVRQAAQALENGDFDNALVLIKQAQANGFYSRFVDLDRLLEFAENIIEQRAIEKEAEHEYEYIADLFEFESMRSFAIQTLIEFQKEFPNYDPKHLARRYLQGIETDDDEEDEPEIVSQQIDDWMPQLLPMLEWCDVPFGVVHVSGVESGDEYFGDTTVRVDNFVMSKYPVTNSQFDIFIKAEDGYHDPRWWQFSEHAQAWFEEKDGPRAPRFLGDERPRENVNWYEAVAFCNWLSYRLKMKITLPTVAQWQRAAQADDDRFFPWGNNYHEDYCNTRESALKMTTPVTRYKDGVSPYGVFDMAGNVWEWTLDFAEPDEESPDYRRGVVGGSFVSPCNRAQTSFRYYLDPRVRYSSIGIRLVGLT